MFDIKNAPREEMKLAFMEALDFIKENEQYSKRHGEDHIDLALKSMQRIRDNKREKKQKLNDEIDYVIDNIKNAQQAY